MRLLAFSDLHRRVAMAEDIAARSGQADLLIGAGDFGVNGEGHADTLEVFRQTGKPMLIVAGNHDSSDAIRAFCADWPDAIVLDGEAVEIAGERFFGLGRETPQSHLEAWNESRTEEKAAALLAAAPAYDILVTHSPPLGYADRKRDGTLGGSRAVRDAVVARQPRLHIFGHVHFSFGAEARLGAARLLNLGPEGTWIDV